MRIIVVLSILFSSYFSFSQKNSIQVLDAQFYSQGNAFPNDINLGLIFGMDFYKSDFNNLIESLPDPILYQLDYSMNWIAGKHETSNEQIAIQYKISDVLKLNGVVDQDLGELAWFGTKDYRGSLLEIDQVGIELHQFRKVQFGLELKNEVFYFSILPFLGFGKQYISSQDSRISLDFAPNGEYLRINSDVEVLMSSPNSTQSTKGFGAGLDFEIGARTEAIDLSIGIQNIGTIQYVDAESRSSSLQNFTYDGINLLDTNAISTLTELLQFRTTNKLIKASLPSQFTFNSTARISDLIRFHITLSQYLQEEWRFSNTPFIQITPDFGKDNRFAVQPSIIYQEHVGLNSGLRMEIGGEHWHIAPAFGGIPLIQKTGSRLYASILFAFYW